MDNVNFPKILKENIVPWELVDEKSCSTIAAENNKIVSSFSYDNLEHSDRIYNYIEI